MRQTECFKIQILRGRLENSFDIKRLSPIHQICNSSSCLSLLPKIIEADPFLFVKDERLYLFYESKDYRKPGVIKMTSTADLKNWTKPRTVLQEPFHLSYPFVFQEGDTTYMMPETCATGEVRLYRAEDNSLTCFTHVATILKQRKDQNIEISYSDASVYKKDGKYYLMVTVMKNGVNHLLLYYADSLKGPYKEHPSSPLVVGMKYGRNAGCLFEKEGWLYRVAQDCVVRYGDNVHLLAVDQMDNATYKEHIVKDNIIPTDMKFYAEGGHQYNYVQFNDSIIVATDAKEYHDFPVARIINRIFKISRILFSHY